MLKPHLITSAVTALTLVALSGSFRAEGSAAQQSNKAVTWEFLIKTDVTVDQVAKLAQDDWEFVGYLGEGITGERVDETLWKRPAR